TPLPNSPGPIIPLPPAPTPSPGPPTTPDPSPPIVILPSPSPESDTITFIPRPDKPSDQIPVDPGGTIPVAAVPGDFNGDGTIDLIVANNGDGRITFLRGEEGGFAPPQMLLDVLHPTALALSPSEDLLYVSDGNERVVRFDLATLEVGLPPPPGP